MASRSTTPRLEPYDYLTRTRTLPVNLLFLMPFLLVYQLALFFTRSPVDNAAAAWVRALASGFGREGTILLTLLVALSLALIVLLRVREATRDHGVFGGMLLEGLCYGALLGTVANVMATQLPMERLVQLAATTAPGEALQEMQVGIRDLGLAVGAGIFEELVFRGLLLAGLHALMRHALGTDRATAAIVSILLSAYVFSDYHHWGLTGEPYSARIFAFRFHAGILLGAVYLYRGLGIAAFAHGFYDVLVMVGR
jgi:membrane protease YdiL (CAAX protease family)